MFSVGVTPRGYSTLYISLYFNQHVTHIYVYGQIVSKVYWICSTCYYKNHSRGSFWFLFFMLLRCCFVHGVSVVVVVVVVVSCCFVFVVFMY